VFGEELVIFVVTFGDFPTISEVIVIVNKTSCWWNLMIAIAVLAEEIYCYTCLHFCILVWFSVCLV